MLDQLLDLSIFFSFDRSGYLRHQKKFAPSAFRDGKGLNALITGGSKGIGFGLCKLLLSLNVSLHITSRDKEKALSQMEILREQFPGASIHYYSFDIASYQDYPFFTAPFDIVVHNAGGMPREKIKATDKYEYVFATHVIGPHLLTRHLMERGRLSPDCRVIFVSSGGMYLRALNLDDLTFDKRPYNPYLAYANAKRAQVDLTELYADHFKEGYLFSCMHPGWVATPGLDQYMPTFRKWMDNRLRTVEEGADTLLWLAMTSSAYPSGRFWFDRKEAPVSLLPYTKTSPETKAALWEFCEEQYRKVATA
ncbi:SDR family NAD(P)-dependent oxidoreductase [Estrella lausannensis]|uniref:NAD dependent dehydratase n=1 Tax=Estrella lausannensis TaxID=483423 RepID=A0A0H5DQA1_9BACT|nr:SDR family NAD(P)-dependent oxidoreductase [Estrella lausannensis]CRX38238.1 NAD dependent dehydratase [Estrella lausannensis]